jgi:hypothetical protein
MGQAEILEMTAAYIAGIILMGTLSWLIGKKTMYVVIINSLLGGILMFILSIFKLLVISAPVMFMTGLIGIAGVIIAFFINPGI